MLDGLVEVLDLRHPRPDEGVRTRAIEALAEPHVHLALCHRLAALARRPELARVSEAFAQLIVASLERVEVLGTFCYSPSPRIPGDAAGSHRVLPASPIAVQGPIGHDARLLADQRSAIA